ncbi:hypothetical protein Ciccas_014364, partial [Cichlidogyrus casuarinus]
KSRAQKKFQRNRYQEHSALLVKAAPSQAQAWPADEVNALIVRQVNAYTALAMETFLEESLPEDKE